MNTQNQNEWNEIRNFANQKLSENFAAAVVLRAQKQRYADRQRNTMVAVCCACILGVGGATWFLENYEAFKSETEWQCLYVENEIMRTTI